MRAAGINWLAVIAAAVAFYLIGFIIYGMLIPEEAWLEMSGMSREQHDAIGTQRLPFGILMPLGTAVFMAVLFKWGGVAGASRGIQWGAVIALASAVPTVWYGWVYGPAMPSGALLDSAHLLIGHAAVGAILGAWR